MTALFTMDCLNGLRAMPDDAVDHSITSPPYNMNLRISGGRYCSRQIVEEIATKYHGFSDNLPMDEYYATHLSVLRELLRVTSGLVFYNIQPVTGNKPALFRIMGDLHEHIKDVIIWDKAHGQPAMRDGVMNSQFEFLFVLSGNVKDAMSRRFKKANFNRGTLSNVWQIGRGRSVVKNHGAVFPEELVRDILLNFTQPGQLIMDPFTGTGTTGKVAIENGREFIGFELSEEYAEIARARILDAERTARNTTSN